MSFSTFKDFDKAITDLVNDDFDSKFSLKVKSCGPFNTCITTNTQLCTKTNKLVPKLTTKWTHNSGFTLEKLEFSSDCKATVETSLVNVVPGLKVEFKGNECDKADVSLTYNHAVATVTADFDVNNFSNFKASVNGGTGPYTAGACADVKLVKSAVDSTAFHVGAGYTLPKQLFVGVRACKNFTDFSALFSYVINKDATVAGIVNHGGKGSCCTLATVYKCNPDTTIKVKATSCGVISASVKQQFEKKFSVIGSAEVPSDFNNVKFGLNAILG
jgi:hypothetical protein